MDCYYYHKCYACMTYIEPICFIMSKKHVTSQTHRISSALNVLRKVSCVRNVCKQINADVILLYVCGNSLFCLDLNLQGGLITYSTLLKGKATGVCVIFYGSMFHSQTHKGNIKLLQLVNVLMITDTEPFKIHRSYQFTPLIHQQRVTVLQFPYG